MLPKEEFLFLWNHATIKVLDIRYELFKPEEIGKSYKLPANMFLYATGGGAEVQIDLISYTLEGFHLIHGGKGSTLQIEATDKGFEYFLIFYRAAIPLTPNKMIARAMQRNNPFKYQYSLVPNSPITMFEKVYYMYMKWENANNLSKFTVKSLFYQLLNEIFMQLDQDSVDIQKLNVSSQIKAYLEQNYAKPLTLESIAKALRYSPSHLSIQFKQQIGYSPIEYLIQLRIEKASILLEKTNASLRDIAMGVGYSDVYYFSRLFKKRVGVSPTKFRQKKQVSDLVKDSPSMSERYSIVDWSFQDYIENGYQYNERKYEPMNKKGLSAIATLFLCLTLLLSACSSGTSSNTGGGEKQVSTTQAASESQTKMVSTMKGDVEIPVNPERVVVMYYTGDVLAFDVTPVGSSKIQEGAAFEEELKTVESLGEWFEPNVEAVIQLKPDVIIIPSKDELYDQMQKIAPTVMIDFSTSLDERLTKIGEVLGKEKEAKELLANFYTKVKDSQEQLKEAGISDKTVSIMEGGKGKMSVVTSYTFGRGSQAIYEYLGMKAPDIIQKKIDDKNNTDEAIDVSLEVLTDYAGDYVFRSSYDGMVDLTDHPVWSNIPAIKEGRLIEMDFGFCYYNDIYSLSKQLDFIVDQLVATTK
ncbi:AraC family transcriptional regulator [Lysinibacillus sp. FSL K6-0057]|uniref:AraC family transcriptional regulator n=1 Tax=Lysinibacillus sp. FSL K6-0057 TaxID=2921411 RepID=UPI00315AD43F